MVTVDLAQWRSGPDYKHLCPLQSVMWGSELASLHLHVLICDIGTVRKRALTRTYSLPLTCGRHSISGSIFVAVITFINKRPPWWGIVKLKWGSVLVCPGRHNKVPQAGRLKQQTFIFLMVLGADSPRSRCQQRWFLVRPLSLACKWPPSCCALTWPFFCTCTCASLFLWGHRPYWDQGPTVMTSVNLGYLSKGLICTYGHFGVKALTYKFLGDTIQSITDGQRSAL